MDSPPHRGSLSPRDLSRAESLSLSLSERRRHNIGQIVPSRDAPLFVTRCWHVSFPHAAALAGNLLAGKSVVATTAPPPSDSLLGGRLGHRVTGEKVEPHLQRLVGKCGRRDRAERRPEAFVAAAGPLLQRRVPDSCAVRQLDRRRLDGASSCAAGLAAWGDLCGGGGRPLRRTPQARSAGACTSPSAQIWGLRPLTFPCFPGGAQAPHKPHAQGE